MFSPPFSPTLLKYYKLQSYLVLSAESQSTYKVLYCTVFFFPLSENTKSVYSRHDSAYTIGKRRATVDSANTAYNWFKLRIWLFWAEKRNLSRTPRLITFIALQMASWVGAGVSTYISLVSCKLRLWGWCHLKEGSSWMQGTKIQHFNSNTFFLASI